MSNTDERTIIAELEKANAELRANAAKQHAEISALREKVWQGRVQTLPGRITQAQIERTIKQAKADGKRHKLIDGGGLCLQVFPSPRGLLVSWLFRWSDTIAKSVYKHRAVGFGSLDKVPLVKAREEALQCREWLREGKDPKIERAQEQAQRYQNKDLFRTIAQVIDEYLQEKIKPRSAKYLNQTQQRLRDYVVKHIGPLPVQSVDRKIIKDILTKDNFWDDLNPTAREVQRHLEAVFNYAIFHRYYVGSNPAKWEDNLEHTLTRRSVTKVQHHRSLNFRELPEWVQRIRAFRYKKPWPITGTGRPIVSYALEFLLLFGGRVGELTQAQWKEFDTTHEMKWTIPAEHTKSGKSRSVPLTTTMLDILNELQRLRFDHSDDALVFPSATAEAQTRAITPLANQTLLRILRDYLGADFVNHGWRSTLKDWCLSRGKTQVSGFVLEWWRMQCDHWEGVPGTELAYGPDRLLEERRTLMQAYDDYATMPPAKSKAKLKVVK